MKHKIKELVPEHEKEITSHTTCDICKRSNKRNPRMDHCETDETEISFRDVEFAHSDCGRGTTYSYDICHDCFAEKVIPALSDLGAEPTIEEWDY